MDIHSNNTELVEMGAANFNFYVNLAEPAGGLQTLTSIVLIRIPEFTRGQAMKNRNGKGHESLGLLLEF